MRIPVRKLPSNLPDARIYLDDLQEVEQIFRDASPTSDLTFEYEVAGDDGADRFTSIRDLEEHGGRSSQFKLLLTSSGSPHRGSLNVLHFYKSTSPSLYYPSDEREQCWLIYGKVEQVFKARQYALRTFVESIPVGVFYVASLCMTIIGTVYFLFHPRTGGAIQGAFIALALGIIGFHLYATNKKSRIVFRYAKANLAEAKKERNRLYRDIALLLLGALLATLLNTLAAHLFPTVAKH
jgi:hypothetical protein